MFKVMQEKDEAIATLNNDLAKQNEALTVLATT